jgi:subtilisin family serine protease
VRRTILGVVVLLAVVAGAPGARAAGDPALGQQWALSLIGAPSAWATGRGVGVTVAVIDSGVDLDHVDLAPNLVGGANCMSALTNGGCRAGGTQDDDGHGTHVAGIVGAVGGNGKGIAGVAPQARIMPVRALRHVCLPLPTGGERCDAEGSVADARSALRWAVDHGADVVNLSVADDVLVRGTAGSPLGPEIKRAWQKGVIVVVAAGNDLDVLMGSRYDGLPALTVGATTRTEAKASYSNSVGDSVWGMVAPGGSGARRCPDEDIVSTYLEPGSNDAYACLSGTSMAAPHVAGAAAVLLSMGLAPSEVVDRILGTTADLGAPGRDPVFGHGRLDLAKAVRSPGAAPREGGAGAVAGGPAPPAPAPAAPGTAAAPGHAPASGTARDASPQAKPSQPSAPDRVRERVGSALRRFDPDESGSIAWWALLAAALIATHLVLGVTTRQKWRGSSP